MASAVRKLTGVGGDIRKIARLLQKEAPPGHMLAYINQEEADLLKARGGSGKPHADTGVPSFEEDPSTYLPDYKDNEMFDIRQSRQADTANAPAEIQPSSVQSQSTAPLDLTASTYGDISSAPSGTIRIDPLSEQMGLSATGNAPSVAPISAEGTTPFRDALATPRETGARESFDTSAIAPGGSEKPTTKVDKDLLGQASDWFSGLSKETKERLGIGGIQAVIGAYQTQQAAEQGRKAKEEMAAMAAPYQQQGKELIAKAQRGELSPVGQQQLQAVQAQAAQGAQARGGVGAQQAQAQVEAYRQQLLQGQYDYGLKVAGIGDQIMTGAIKTGMQADQYVNQLTSNYYNNIARAMYGQAPQTSGQQPSSTTAGQ